jgi:Lar family restriction alleviation protein
MDGAKRCPFCRGKELKFSDLLNPSDGLYIARVACKRCRANGPISKPAKLEEVFKIAIEMWNDRDGG